MTSPFRTNPSLGPNLWQVVRAGQVWYDGTKQIVSPKAGDVSLGDDGFTYVFARATGAIATSAAPGTQVTLTLGASDPRATAAAGAGGYYAPDTSVMTTALAAGDYAWFRKGTTP